MLLNDFGRTLRAGGYAQVAVAHHTMAAALPADADLPRVTAALVNGVTAWIALRELARATPADTVVVLGASGGLGGTTARLAALLPCRRVVGVVSRDPARAPSACTDVVLTDDLPAWLDVAENSVDVVVDPVEGDARRPLFDRLAPFGRHLVLGNATGDDPEFTGDAAWHGTRTPSGLSLGAVAHLRPDMVQTALTAVVDLVTRGVLDEPAPEIRPLTDAREVHQAIADRSAPPKTVLDAGG